MSSDEVAFASEAAPAHHSIHVLIPSHSYTLTISTLTADATVSDLKAAISEQCPGRPSISGQRVIVQGRVLKEEEPIGGLGTVHLAVHPAAWTATPPPSPRRPGVGLPAASTPSIPMAPLANPPPSNEPPLPLTLQLSSLPTEFIAHVHANALRILSAQPTIPWPGPSELSHARRVARTVIKYAGLGWPPVLDGDIPPTSDTGPGLQYTHVIIDNLPYLALASPDASPTAAQRVALQILTYTFPLLPLMKHLPRPAPVSNRSRPPQTANAQAQVQQVQNIRRFGFNVQIRRAVPGRVPNPGAFGAPPVEGDEDPRAYFPPVPEFRFQFQFHLPPSRVLLQLLFTLSRAALLLYFFEPARKPMWLACIVGWIGWEIFVVFRGNGGARQIDPARGDGAPPNGDGAQNAPAAEAQAGNNAVVARAPGGRVDTVVPQNRANRGPNPPETLAPVANANEITRFVNRLANMNLASESEALNLATRLAGPDPSTDPHAPTDPHTPLVGPTQSLAENRADVVAVEPSLVHRSTTFITLFTTSLIPAIWEMRCARLRERERWVRDMFVFGQAEGRNAPNVTLPEEAGPGGESGSGLTQALEVSGPELAKRRRASLAGWRKAYVDRVVSGEAGDYND